MKGKMAREEINIIPPQSLQAERNFLAGLILDNKVIVDILDRIKPDDFYTQAHQDIFQAIFSLYEAKDPIDLVTLSNELGKKGRLDSIGGQAYLISLLEYPTSANLIYHAEIIKEKSILRALLNHSYEIQQKIKEGKDAPDLIAESSQYLSNLAQQNIKEDFLEPRDLAHKFSDELSYRVDNKITYQGISTSYYRLDNLIGGFNEGDFIVVGAPQKMGKTAFLLDLVKRICIKDNLPCLYLTLEMNEDQILARLLSKTSGIELEKIRHANFMRGELKEVLDALAKYSQSKVYIHFSPGIDLFKLCAEVKRIKAKHDLKMVFVDYIQLISNVLKGRQRYEEVGGISRALKNLAGELKIVILAAAQLDSNIPEDGRPRFNSIRESKSVEHDCDVLAFINRPKWQELQNQNNSAELIVRGTRHGRSGIVRLEFDERTVSFVERQDNDENL